MAERKLLVENLSVPFSEWKTELVTAPGLVESLVMPEAAKFNELVLATKNERLIEHWRSGKDGILQELMSSSSRMRATGPAQREGVKNENGRIYGKDVWDLTLAENSMFMRRLKERRTLGELEHPESGSTKLHGHNMLGLSHLVESVERKDGIIYATHLIFNTPAGRLVREYFENKVPVCVSSRGSGSTRMEGGAEIVEASDFILDTFDFVFVPSVSIAVAQPVYESVCSPAGETENTKGGSRIFLVPVFSEKSKMNVSLKESSDRTARARLVLEASGQYISGKEVTLEGLLENAQKVSECLSGLGMITESEFASDVANLRGALTSRSEEITRMIKKLREEEEDKIKDDEEDEDEDEAPKKKKDDEEEEKTKKEPCDDSDMSVEEALQRTFNRNRSLRERYQVAIKLGETLTKRAREMKANYESTIKSLNAKLSETKKRAEATTRLMEAVVRRYRKEQVKRFAESVVKENPALKSVENQISNCRSLKEAKAIVEGIIKPLMEGSKRKYPSDLPPLTETVSQPGPAREDSNEARPSNLMEALLRRKS